MAPVHRSEKTCTGVWIDQAGATIVTLGDEGASAIRRVESNVVRHFRPSGGRKAGTQTQEVLDEKRIERKREQQLERYYESLAESLVGAERVLLIGPGEAKQALARVLEKPRGKKAPRVTVRTADKMTDPQLVAAVKRFFDLDA